MPAQKHARPLREQLAQVRTDIKQFILEPTSRVYPRLLPVLVKEMVFYFLLAQCR